MCSFALQEVGKRALRNECLRFITARKYNVPSSSTPSEGAAAKLRVNMALDQYFLAAGACMTDTVAALTALLAM